MPEVLAHAGGHLLDSIIQLVVFLGPVPVIFYFLLRAMLAPDDEESRPSPAPERPVTGEPRRRQPTPADELRSPQRAP
jgi:hypothetical protein